MECRRIGDTGQETEKPIEEGRRKLKTNDVRSTSRKIRRRLLVRGLRVRRDHNNLLLSTPEEKQKT